MKNKMLNRFSLVSLLFWSCALPGWADEPYPVAARTIVNMFNQGENLYQQHRYREALDTFARAESLFPEKNHIWDADMFQWMGKCAFALPDYNLADQYYGTAYQKYSLLGTAGAAGCSDVSSARAAIAEERHKHSIFNIDNYKTTNTLPKYSDSFNIKTLDLKAPSHVYDCPFGQTTQMFPLSPNKLPALQSQTLPTFAPLSPTLPSLNNSAPAAPSTGDSAWDNQMKQLQKKIDQLGTK